MYHLFLDDDRQPWDVSWVQIPSVPWTIVRNYEQFVSTIKDRYIDAGIPATVSFDHDLGEEHYANAAENFQKFRLGDKAYVNYDKFVTKTGYHAQWLVDFCLDHDLSLPDCFVHSKNPVGSENITALLQSAQREIGRRREEQSQ